MRTIRIFLTSQYRPGLQLRSARRYSSAQITSGERLYHIHVAVWTLNRVTQRTPPPKFDCRSELLVSVGVLDNCHWSPFWRLVGDWGLLVTMTNDRPSYTANNEQTLQSHWKKTNLCPSKNPILNLPRFSGLLFGSVRLAHSSTWTSISGLPREQTLIWNHEREEKFYFLFLFSARKLGVPQKITCRSARSQTKKKNIQPFTRITPLSFKWPPSRPRRTPNKAQTFGTLQRHYL